MRFIAVVFLTLLFSGTSFAVDKGKSLYMKHCIACHGAYGQGGVGVPLALKSFQSHASDQFIKNSIRLGRKGRVMPAFNQLNENQLSALVTYIRSFTDVVSPKHSNVVIAGNEKHGGQLFIQHCAACHGAKGQGGKGTGVTFSRPRDFQIIAPALNNIGFLTSASDSMIQKTLQEGRNGTPMKSFLKQGLSHQDIDDIVVFVRSFEKQSVETTTSIDEPTYLEVESSESLEDTVKSLKAAIIGNNYRLIRVQNLDFGLVKAKREDTHKVVIYFCNFSLLNKALAVDPRVGLFLPCRLTVVEHKGKVKVLAINPTHLSRLFNNDELNQLCVGMRQTYEAIMNEAIL